MCWLGWCRQHIDAALAADVTPVALGQRIFAQGTELVTRNDAPIGGSLYVNGREGAGRS